MNENETLLFAKLISASRLLSQAYPQAEPEKEYDRWNMWHYEAEEIIKFVDNHIEAK